MTLHAAKGLEFPVVFIVGLEQGLLPHARSGESDAELEEERRLLFVGITRAQRELYLSHCRLREFRGQRTATIPSCFLNELPEDAIQEHDRSGYDPTPVLRARSRRPGPIVPSSREGSDSPPRRTWPVSGRHRAARRLDGVRPGSSVLHPKYGLGRVVAIEGRARIVKVG